MEEKCRKAEMARGLRKFLGRNEDAAAVENVKVKNVKMPDLLSALASLTEADMDRYACSEMLDCMEAFYKISHSYLQPQSSSNLLIYCHENVCRYRCALSSRILSPLRPKCGLLSFVCPAVGSATRIRNHI